MKLHRLLCAVALGLSSFAAQATVFTYTGNTFDQVAFGDPSARVTAWFDIDESAPLPGPYHNYPILAWGADAGPVHLGSADGKSTVYAEFWFDANGKIDEWYFQATLNDLQPHVDPGTDVVYYTGTVQNIESLAKTVRMFPPYYQDAVTVYRADEDRNESYEVGAVTDRPGTWSRRAEVPEPAAIALLALGGAALAGTRRRRRAGA